MIISDPIYGDFEITEPVLLELLEEPAVLRAGKIMQGATTPIINGWPDYSRLEHCIGVMLIIRKLGGAIEEQVAGLLHDISHTAFSHVIDYVYSREGTHDYHEHIKEKIIRESGIPKILSRYGFDLDYILDDSNFTLLEQNSPELCADRVDYCLRSLAYYYSSADVSQSLFEHLSTFAGKIVFDSQDSAIAFARSFYLLDIQILAFDRNVAAYCIFADAIRKSVEREYLVESDFLLTDEVVLAKLHSIADSDIRQLLALLTVQLRIVEDVENYDYRLQTKARWVNPSFRNSSDSVDTVFSVDRDLGALVLSHRENLKKPKFVRVYLE